MATYRITFRSAYGDVRIEYITAMSESDARAKFYNRYDGRIIACDML